MIELTQEQWHAFQQSAGQPLPMVAPASHEKFVLVPRELYESLIEYDDSGWTDEERSALAVQIDAMLDDDMAIERVF